MNSITNLNTFKKKGTFALLKDRITHIEDLIIKTIVLRNTLCEVETINLLQTKGFDLMKTVSVYSEYVFVLYRSMFQASKWENSKTQSITTEAFSFTPGEQGLHRKITIHVNKKTAHQDIYKNEPYRYLYEPLKHEGKTFYLVCDNREHHVDALIPLVNKIHHSIVETYESKFGEKLYIARDLYKYLPL
jgi:hypothetical protein